MSKVFCFPHPLGIPPYDENDAASSSHGYAKGTLR